MAGDKNRGEFLNKIITQKGINIGKLMTRMGYHRTTYYTHINQPELDYSILSKYAKEIPYDFAIEFPEMRQYITEPQNQVRSIKDVEADRDKWKEKYYDLLEKYNNLLEQSK